MAFTKSYRGAKDRFMSVARMEPAMALPMRTLVFARCTSDSRLPRHLRLVPPLPHASLPVTPSATTCAFVPWRIQEIIYESWVRRFPLASAPCRSSKFLSLPHLRATRT